jgi:hypothetical protein
MGTGMVLFWALIVVGIVALVSSNSGNQRGGRPAPGDAPSPERLLAGRFARGEIDETHAHDHGAHGSHTHGHGHPTGRGSPPSTDPPHPIDDRLDQG